MSDLMLFGVLRMPYDMAMEGEVSRIQFYGRAQQAADRLERSESNLAAARALLREALAEIPDGYSDDLIDGIRAHLDDADKKEGAA